MTAPAPLLLRFEEAARVLSIGRTALYGLVSTGQLEAISIGRSRRIPVTACEEFVARRRAEANGEPR